MIVVDASTVVEVLVQSADARAVEERLFRAGEALHAPHLLDVEALSALRRLEAKGFLDADRSRTALGVLSDLALWRHAHDLYLPRIWELRFNLSPYDATYVALAETLDATLLTRDARLASAPGHHARIELI